MIKVQAPSPERRRRLRELAVAYQDWAAGQSTQVDDFNPDGQGSEYGLTVADLQAPGAAYDDLAERARRILTADGSVTAAAVSDDAHERHVTEGDIMPWHIERGHEDCGNGYAVVKDTDGSIAGCHANRTDAVAQIRALYAAEADKNESMSGGDTEGQTIRLQLDIPSSSGVAPATEPGEDEIEEPEESPEIKGGTPWEGTLLVEGEWSGDGQMFMEDSATWAPLPLPLLWQPEGDEEHRGAVIVGRIDQIWRDGNKVRAAGVMDSAGESGAEAERLMSAGMLRGISIMADDIIEEDIEVMFPGDVGEGEQPEHVLPVGVQEAPPITPPGGPGGGPPITPPGGPGGGPPITPPGGDPTRPGNLPPSVTIPTAPGEGFVPVHEDKPLYPTELTEPRILIHKGRIRSATLVSEPAFTEAEIHLTESKPETLSSGPNIVTAAGYTITIPELWPESWFEKPAEPPAFGALHVTPEGRIYGLLAPAGVSHRGFRASGRHVTAPRRIDYSEFMNKQALVATADGGVARINAGTITLDCGHASPEDPRRVDPSFALQHYENSCSVVARVRVGEYPDGSTWVAGGLLHGVDADTVERMMGCALSGDWQAGKLNAALLVPVEGFPRAQTANVRIREGALVSSSMPVRFDDFGHRPNLRPALEIVARSIGRDAQGRLNEIRTRVRKGR